MIYNNINQLKQVLSREGRLMGLDVGTKTIGVAISDLTRTISNPKITLNRKSNQKDFAALLKIIQEIPITAIIIGLPLNMDNSNSEMSGFIKRFSSNLDQFLKNNQINHADNLQIGEKQTSINNVPILLYDERLTSFVAGDILKNELHMDYDNIKNKIDKIAANVILQSFLEELSNES